jgi:hypothetical protein
MTKITSAPALRVFSLDFSRRVLPPELCGSLPCALLDPMVQNHFMPRDFMKIFVFSWKTSRSSCSRTSRSSATCLLRRWMISLSSGLRQVLDPFAHLAQIYFFRDLGYSRTPSALLAEFCADSSVTLLGLKTFKVHRSSVNFLVPSWKVSLSSS